MLTPLFRTFEAALKCQPVFKGFRFSSTHRHFSKRVDGQVWAVGFAYIKHVEDFDVTCHVAIRYDVVEERLNKSRADISDKEKSNTYTIGAELGNLAGTGQKRVTIATADDASRAAATLAAWVEQIGLPFFQLYADPNATATALFEPSTARIICPIRPEEKIRAFRDAGYGV